MKKLRFHGIEVNFPYEPYECQNAYISKCLEAMISGTHAVLESPTGTGKTLCLLSAVLSYRDHISKKRAHDGQPMNKPGEKENAKEKSNDLAPRIIYASRTHSQLTQVVAEAEKLRRDCNYNIDSTVLGGRSALCSNPDVSQERDQFALQMACTTARKQKACGWKTRFDDLPAGKYPYGVIDIEELVNYSQRGHVCAYYLSRAKAKMAKVIMMPYNYLLDTRLRERHKIEVSNSIIILDEAHNIEQVCEEASSYIITSKDIHSAMLEVEDVIEIVAKQKGSSSGANIPVMEPTNTRETANGEPSMKISDVGVLLRQIILLRDGLKKLLHDLDQRYSFFAKEESAGKFKKAPEGKAFDPMELYKFFKDSQILPNIHDKYSYSYLDAVFEQVQEYITKKSGPRALKLEIVMEVLKFFHKIPEKIMETELEAFRMYVTAVFKKGRMQKFMEKVTGAEIEINFWCFDASRSIKSLLKEGVRNVILTSGTLSPLAEYTENLGLQNDKGEPVTLINNHVIDKEQVSVMTIKHGMENTEFKNVYANRENKKMFSEMADTVARIKKVTPGGMLIFHPTYLMLEKTQEYWNIRGKLACDTARNQFGRKVFIEPKDKTELEKTTLSFETEICDKPQEGAIYMGVFRGKLSEGVDFKDDTGRVVVITGIPFAPFKDPKVTMKKLYVDKRLKDGKGTISGDQWYETQALRAVNQAVGRIIRHKDDFGAIIYLDCRFAQKRYENYMPQWIKEQHKVYDQADKGIGQIRAFFSKMKAYQKRGRLSIPEPKVMKSAVKMAGIFNPPFKKVSPDSSQIDEKALQKEEKPVLKDRASNLKTGKNDLFGSYKIAQNPANQTKVRPTNWKPPQHEENSIFEIMNKKIKIEKPSSQSSPKTPKGIRDWLI